MFEPSFQTTTEEYWYKELATIYPYGLNDNVKKVGNVSKKGTENIVVWALFNKKQRKFKKLSEKGKRQHDRTRAYRLRALVSNYNKPGLVHELSTPSHHDQSNGDRVCLSVCVSIVRSHSVYMRVLI